MINSDLDLRHNEQVIDEFGVSIKYTVLLGLIGIMIISGTMLFRTLGSHTFNNIADGLGIYGPLVLNAILIGFLVLGIYLISLGLFFHFAYRYYLTTERAIEAVGLLSRRAVSAEYRAISDLVVRQDAINHLILNTGTLGVDTFGGMPEEVELRNIDNPIARREQLRGLSEAAHDGQAVTPDMLNELKRQTGMLRDKNVFDQKNKPDAKPTVPPSESSTIITSQLDPNGENVEESDRLREAQKNLKP
jgi:uncharacterized membrane protein YdbT with pleckstrin-like domain